MPGMLYSCTCANPLIVSEIQKSDKKLTCKDVILEINESEHYRDLAAREEGIGFGEALMPVCWVSSFVNASRARKAAEDRISYLGHIYDVMDCGGKSDKKGKVLAPAAVPFVPVQPALMPPKQPMQIAPENINRENVSESSPKNDGQCSSDIDIEKNTHRHVDKFGRAYVHCHANSGPHRHLDDQ